MRPESSPDKRPSPRGLVQAPVEPLDADGVQIAIIGTLGWALAGVVTLFLNTPQWWSWTCGVAVALGLIGIGYTMRRRRDAQSKST